MLNIKCYADFFLKKTSLFLEVYEWKIIAYHLFIK